MDLQHILKVWLDLTNSRNKFNERNINVGFIARSVKVRDRGEADSQRHTETLTHPTIKEEADKRTHLRHVRDQILYQHCDTLQCHLQCDFKKSIMHILE